VRGQAKQTVRAHPPTQMVTAQVGSGQGLAYSKPVKSLAG
jgi:hypothetical protein